VNKFKVGKVDQQPSGGNVLFGRSVSMKRTLPLLALMFIASAALGQPSDDAVQKCADLTDDQARLSCFDNLAKGLGRQNESADDPKTTIVQTPPPLPASEYQVVDPSDLYVTPGKYIDKPIQLRRVRCLYANEDEYRCTTDGATVMILAEEVTPPVHQQIMQRDCQSMKQFSTSKCVRTIRFIPTESRSDVVSNYQTRKIIVTIAIEVVPRTVARKKKR
jgi:hypothetical protein